MGESSSTVRTMGQPMPSSSASCACKPPTEMRHISLFRVSQPCRPRITGLASYLDAGFACSRGLVNVLPHQSGFGATAVRSFLLSMLWFSPGRRCQATMGRPCALAAVTPALELHPAAGLQLPLPSLRHRQQQRAAVLHVPAPRCAFSARPVRELEQHYCARKRIDRVNQGE